LLDSLDWNAIAQLDWRNPDVKEAKQSEFLVEESFPWNLVETIGVINRTMCERVACILVGARHQPRVAVAPEWYY
jgi:hypothetical protein